MSFLLLLIVGTGIIGAALWYGYAALSQSLRDRIASLEGEVTRLDAALTESERARGALSVTLEETRAELRFARTRYDRDVPDGAALRLHELARRMLDEGVAPERIAFLIRLASRPLSCAEAPETRLLRLEVDSGLVDGTIARLGDGDLMVSGSGTAARDEAGRPEAWFDPQYPVTLTLTRRGGARETLEGVLPLSRSVPLEGAEFRIEATAEDRGMVALSATRCAYW